VLTVKEVAVYLRVSRVTVWRWCQRGTLPALRVGRNWRIHRDDLLNILERSPPLLPVVIAEENVDCVEDGSGSELDTLEF
jgi:excisionase family DNA binding protein